MLFVGIFLVSNAEARLVSIAPLLHQPTSSEPLLRIALGQALEPS